MKERIEAIKEYLKYFPKESQAEKNLLLCEYAEELNMELTDGYYPRIEYGYFVVNPQIKVGKTYNLTNSATKYRQNRTDSIVIWSESRGRLAFVNDAYWWDVENEWENFMNVLKSYNPLDYDDINDVYIYNLENGKKLINDYKKIQNDFLYNANEKIKEVQFAYKKKELERLAKELNREVNI